MTPRKISPPSPAPRPALAATVARMPAWAPAAFIFLATLIAYAPVLRAGFVWNDLDYVTRPELRSLRGLWRIWFEVGSTEQHYPLLHSFFWFEHRLWGDAAPAYHLVNLLLHAANACLFARILRRLLPAPHVTHCVTNPATHPTLAPAAFPPSPPEIENRESKIENLIPWLVGLVFALHPVAVESVAWISEQKNTLSTFFYLAAALAYLRYDDERTGSSAAVYPAAGAGSPADPAPPSAPRSLLGGGLYARQPSAYRVATIFFVLALLTKSLTATLPAALLVVLWWRRGALRWRRDVVPLLPWFAVGALMGIFSAWVEHRFVGASGVEFDLTPLQRVLVAGRAVWFYLGKTLWPANLAFIYPRWHVDPAIAWQWFFPTAALAFTTALWALRRRSRAPLAAWLFFIGSLFPVMGFFSLYAYRYSFVADHWQYLPALGVIAFVVVGGAHLLARLPARATAAGATVVAAIIVTFAALSWRQARAYHDIVTFYRTIIADNPGCWMAHSNLGDFYFRANLDRSTTARLLTEANLTPALRDELLAANLLDAALAQYRETLRLNPTHVEGHNSLASACLQAGLADEALAHFQRALELRPDYPDALGNLGFLLVQLGRPADALEPLRHALRLRPRYAEAHDHLGSALLALGRVDEAIRAHREALRLNPKFHVARNNLGNALVQAGRIDEAIAAYEQVLRDNPADTDVRVNLGNAFARADRLPEAIAAYEAALRQRPTMPEAHNNLGFALLRLGRVDDAVARFRRALELRPDYPDARRNLDLAGHTTRSEP